MHKLGIVNFINTSAIYLPWKVMGPLSGWEVVEGPPTLLNRLLLQGSLDAGLISSYAYGINKDIYYLLPELSISATGPVGSVLLFSKVPVHDLDKKKIILTPDSATSVALLKIILKKYYSINPVYSPGTYNDIDSKKTFAYLSIGDEALRISQDWPYPYRLDLAEVWLKCTGFPFVFAVFALRKECWEKTPESVQILFKRLVSCHLRGKKELFSICEKVAPNIPMDADACLRYLKGIEHDFSLEKQNGLIHFFNLIREVEPFPYIDRLDFVPLSYEEFTTNGCKLTDKKFLNVKRKL